MIAPFALVLAIVAVTPEETRALHRMLPCTPGLTVEYEVEAKNKPGAKPSRFVDVVIGAGKLPGTCLIERTAAVKETLMRELLPDRVANAGWADQPVAFRTPFLKLPLARGTKWRFNTTEFEIREVNAQVEVPAGKLEGCVRVAEKTRDGSHEAESVYAPDIGLVFYETRDARQRAVRVTFAYTEKTKQESPRTSR